LSPGRKTSLVFLRDENARIETEALLDEAADEWLT
jgi:hypothetical protein